MRRTQQSDEAGASAEQESTGRLTRRTMLSGVVGAVGGLAVGTAVTATAIGAEDRAEPAGSDHRPAEAAARVAIHGATQPGIARPRTPQRFGLLVVGDVHDSEATDFVPALGRHIERVLTDTGPGLLPEGAGDLTVTVGLGSRLIAAHDPELAEGLVLPKFAGDGQIAESATGGDVLLALYGADPTVLRPVADRLVSNVTGYRERWSQSCFRAPGTGTVARNPLGFLDNIEVPQGRRELAENVWLTGKQAGGTICVVRRLRLDIDGFRGQSVEKRQSIIGRTVDGVPLSGGKALSPVNVDAKTASGAYRIPLHAHVRAAHPSFTGSKLMLRRGYAFDNGDGDAGLMFVCFQRDLRTFTATQHRLDEVDHLMDYVTPTASAAFLILPGFTAKRPLGSTLSWAP